MTKKNKTKLLYVCNNCGEDYPKWHGRCVSCGEWDSLKEFRQPNITSTKNRSFKNDTELPIPLSDCIGRETQRILTGISEIDRVLGGGIVSGALMLIGGNPGIGKSTLMLQIASSLGASGKSVLYCAGEESPEQIALRGDRLSIQHNAISVLAETSVNITMAVLEKEKPDIIIVDSIQTSFSEDLESAPGTVSQVRECASQFMRYAKSTNAAVFLVGHVTKDGSIAGPRVLEHMVDTVLYFEGDSQYHYRMLRAVKNRFGASGEIALFSMRNNGLCVVPNASEYFLIHRNNPQIGSAIVPVCEGSRILVVELQTLVNPTHFGMPQRVANGINPKRLALILAVLERFGGIVLGDHDIFFNITGGLTISEPAIDCAIAAAILSSFRNSMIDAGTAFIGELGLGGELRPVHAMDARLRELEAMGFSRCFIPKSPKRERYHGKMELIICSSIADFADALLS